jgi:hypothetical protein
LIEVDDAGKEEVTSCMQRMFDAGSDDQRTGLGPLKRGNFDYLHGCSSN